MWVYKFFWKSLKLFECHQMYIGFVSTIIYWTIFSLLEEGKHGKGREKTGSTSVAPEGWEQVKHRLWPACPIHVRFLTIVVKRRLEGRKRACRRKKDNESVWCSQLLIDHKRYFWNLHFSYQHETMIYISQTNMKQLFTFLRPTQKWSSIAR